MEYFGAFLREKIGEVRNKWKESVVKNKNKTDFGIAVTKPNDNNHEKNDK